MIECHFLSPFRSSNYKLITNDFLYQQNFTKNHLSNPPSRSPSQNLTLFTKTDNLIICRLFISSFFLSSFIFWKRKSNFFPWVKNWKSLCFCQDLLEQVMLCFCTGGCWEIMFGISSKFSGFPCPPGSV
jgi:hypothetical protein